MTKVLHHRHYYLLTGNEWLRSSGVLEDENAKLPPQTNSPDDSEVISPTISISGGGASWLLDFRHRVPRLFIDLALA